MDKNNTRSVREHGGIEQRVWMHWKSMRGYRTFVVDRVEDGLTPGGLVYGHYEMSTPNHVWLHLARVHKMKVRRVKDIINARRALSAPASVEQDQSG